MKDFRARSTFPARTFRPTAVEPPRRQAVRLAKGTLMHRWSSSAVAGDACQQRHGSPLSSREIRGRDNCDIFAQFYNNKDGVLAFRCGAHEKETEGKQLCDSGASAANLVKDGWQKLPGNLSTRGSTDLHPVRESTN